MSEPSKTELAPLEKARSDHDDEAYHSIFDGMLETKLDELDLEWMMAMRELYAKSHMGRWCA